MPVLFSIHQETMAAVGLVGEMGPDGQYQMQLSLNWERSIPEVIFLPRRA